MTGDRDEKIRKRAHAIWEAEGRPSGAHDRHWRQAESEVDGPGKKPAKSTAKPRAAAAPKATAKPKAAKAPAKPKK